MDDQPGPTKPDYPSSELASASNKDLVPASPPLASPLTDTQSVTPTTPGLPQQEAPQFPTASTPKPQVQSQVISPQQTPTFVNQASQNGLPMKHSKRRLMSSLAVVILVLGGVFALKGLQGANKLDCVPPSGNSVTETVAISEFKAFAQAIRSSNQTCANSLSSSFFLGDAKVSMGAPNGNWITAVPDGISSWASNFSKLPNNLINAQFVKKNYTRETAENANGTVVSYYKPATGLTLGYPTGTREVSGKDGSSEFYYFVSFVSQNGKVLVDNVIAGPAGYF